MIPVDEALRIVLSVAERLPPVAVPLHEALGLILAEDVRAPDPLPPYRASIKASARQPLLSFFLRLLFLCKSLVSSETGSLALQDGFAVVASDGPGVYTVITESRAGDDGVGVVVTPGTVAYIRDSNRAMLIAAATQQHCKAVFMKPGKPLTFAQITANSKNIKLSKPVLAFGFPGNPVSCLVCFNLFAVPAIRHLSGWANPQLQRFIAESTGKQMSSRLLSMKSANALLELPATGQIFEAGNSVQAILISDISSLLMSKLTDSMASLSVQYGPAMRCSARQPIAASQESMVKVAILTVSDTVSSGSGPDRRYAVAFVELKSIFCSQGDIKSLLLHYWLSS
ncbi:hypothetical protein BHE74_00048950 [Ensete ventricosum]|nr:hypothetical protein BHE74_00048950 [Ensete ventricosum]